MLDATKRKIGAKNKGRSPWTKGRPRSEETRKKISQGQLGNKRSEATKKKQSDSMKGKAPWNKGLKGIPWSPARRKAHAVRYGSNR